MGTAGYHGYAWRPFEVLVNPAEFQPAPGSHGFAPGPFCFVGGLRPAVGALRPTAGDLRPAVGALRPTVGALRFTVSSAVDMTHPLSVHFPARRHIRVKQGEREQMAPGLSPPSVKSC